MSFLSPLFLIGAAAAAIPIVLHLLQRAPEARVKFAVVRLLRQTPVERTDRRRLRELLLLALRVAALVLLALAFARPFLASALPAGSSGVAIVALDTSLSMSAPGRFERAKDLARRAIDGAPAGDLVGVVTFDSAARVAAAPSGDRGLARSAIDAAAAGFAATRYRAALTQAADLVRGRSGAIVVVTDLQENGWAAGDRAEIPESARIEILDAAGPAANLAVVAVRTADDRVVATVRNSPGDGGGAREARVRLTVDGRPAGEGAVAIPPNQTAEIPLPPARGGAGSVAVDDPGGVQGDNVRYFVLEASTRPVVLVVTGDGDLSREALYAGHALAASGAAGAAYRVAGVSGRTLSTWDAARLADHAAILLLSTRGLERAGRALIADYLRHGGGALVAAGPQIDGEVISESFAGLFTIADSTAEAKPASGRGRRLVPADLRHPLFQAFGANAAPLGLPAFERIGAVRGDGDTCQTLARFTTGEAAIIDCSMGEGRALVLASDLNGQWNDFPRHATFVPFMHEAVRYLAGNRPRTSDYLVGQTPPGVPPTPGIVSVPGQAAGRRVAVNVDPEETNPARLTPEGFQAALTRTPDTVEAEQQAGSRQVEERQRLWQYLLGAMLAVLLIESLVASKTA
jgi:hypothetical protein